MRIRIVDSAVWTGKNTSPFIHHHQVVLLLAEHRASMKSLQAWRSPAIPLPSFLHLPVPLISYSLHVLTFQNPILVVHFMPKGLPLVSGRLLVISLSLLLMFTVCRLLAYSTRSQ
jgi:hypothetical protein